MKRSIGGNRLGSGNKMNVYLHNYGRSTHNLSTVVRTTAAPGVLYPIYTTIGLNGDTFNIDISTLVRTLPTQAPLFGSFKMQIDVFGAPIRLYNGVLHNNPLNVGMNMNKIYMPKAKIYGSTSTPPAGKNEISKDVSNSCLWKYLGLSGLGTWDDQNDNEVARKINALPAIAYYDIFKNYYANKQEESFYQIAPNEIKTSHFEYYSTIDFNNNVTGYTIPYNITGDEITNINKVSYKIDLLSTISIGNDLSEENILQEVAVKFVGQNSTAVKIYTLEELRDLNIINNLIFNFSSPYRYFRHLQFTFASKTKIQQILGFTNLTLVNLISNPQIQKQEIQLSEQALSDIDDLRNYLLKESEIGTEVEIQKAMLPFIENITINDYQGISYNAVAMNGLVTKTFQSDLFNNWVSTEWVDGITGINEISKVSTESGGFTIDALNLAQKVYNMLNRIAVSGGTYQDWQEAVYSQKTIKQTETPIYYGSLSSEIVFEEVVSTSAENQGEPLGTLAGKGIQSNVKGGKIKIKVQEPMVIMAIMSLTPRVDYSQGNAWYMTELDTLDDLHKPALDAIGFQDLNAEQLAWWATTINQNGVASRQFIGKQPAWIHYMTDVNHLYGEFAAGGEIHYMTLAKDYERVNGVVPRGVKGTTTYIDPSKFNYAFAYSKIDAQNFWVQVGFDIKARRVMSAKVIPNL